VSITDGFLRSEECCPWVATKHNARTTGALSKAVGRQRIRPDLEWPLPAWAFRCGGGRSLVKQNGQHAEIANDSMSDPGGG
jgi:hypothetical protein